MNQSQAPIRYIVTKAKKNKLYKNNKNKKSQKPKFLTKLLNG